MDWLLSHGDQLNDLPDEEPAGAKDQQVPEETTTTSGENEKAEEPQMVKSIKCEDCGKLFKTQEEVEFHATKSGSSFVIQSSFPI